MSTISVRAAARALGVHENTIRNWMAEGLLKAHSMPNGYQRPDAADVLRLARDDDHDDSEELGAQFEALAERLEARVEALRDAARRMRRNPP